MYRSQALGARFGKKVDLLRYPLTDYGNAERLIALFGQDIHYHSEPHSWFAWDGKRWKRDRDGFVQRLTKQTARTLYAQAVGIKEKEDRDQCNSFARRSENARGIRDALECARSIKGVTLLSEQLDTDPFLLNCTNGTLDLRTGELREHRRGDLISKICRAKYDLNARCTQFLRFLNRIFDGNTELIGYVQRVLGYSLTADVSEKAVFCAHGSGDNGKTTLVEIYRYVLGDYAGQIMIESLLQKPSNGQSSASLADLADLKGKRFVTTSEAEYGAKLAEAQVKQVSGMAMYKACRKYENPIQFSPTWKIFMDTNYKPQVRGKDAAIWNRLKLIEFGVRIPKREMDKNLLKNLRSEASGILAWAVRGCLAWQENGLQEPPAVRQSVDAWRCNSDQFGGFFGTVCELDPNAICSAKALADAFRKFKKTDSLDVSQRDLIAELQRLGCTPRRSSRERFWRGIRLKPE